MLAHAAAERAEFHRVEELQQHAGIGFADGEVFPLVFDRDVVAQRHELARDADLVGEVDQRLAALLLLHFVGAFEDGIERAERVDEFGGGLGADAGRAGNVVGAVADQRLRVDHLVGRDAELLHHRFGTERFVLHRIVELDHVIDDELHQVFVGRDDLHRRAVGGGLARIGGDEIVGLEAAHLDARQIERARGVADQRKLRDEIFRRRRAVGFVFGIEFVAERELALVEDDGEVRRRFAPLHLVQELPQHVAKAGDGAGAQAIARARQRRQRVVGAKNVARAVDQEEPGRVCFLAIAPI